MRAVSKKRAARRPAARAAREAVFQRDRGCVIAHLHDCSGPLTPHHLLKQSQGGTWDMSNLVALCAYGNGWVEDNPEKARWWGLSIAKGVTATEAARRRAALSIAPTWRAPASDGTAA